MGQGAGHRSKDRAVYQLTLRSNSGSPPASRAETFTFGEGYRPLTHMFVERTCMGSCWRLHPNLLDLDSLPRLLPWEVGYTRTGSDPRRVIG